MRVESELRVPAQAELVHLLYRRAGDDMAQRWWIQVVWVREERVGREF